MTAAAAQPHIPAVAAAADHVSEDDDDGASSEGEGAMLCFALFTLFVWIEEGVREEMRKV